MQSLALVLLYKSYFYLTPQARGLIAKINKWDLIKARLQQYVNCELQAGLFKLVLEEAEEPEIKANIWWIMKKAREFQKNIYLCFIEYAKSFDCVDHNKL